MVGSQLRRRTRTRGNRRVDFRQARKCAVVTALLTVVAGHALEQKNPREGWNFKFKHFLIGAWLGPDGTEGEVQVYKEAGFNVVMVGRYMAHGEYAIPDRVARELELAHQYRLGAMIDTYTQNDRPWGGVVPPAGKGHHPSSLAELTWIHEKFGRHPALVGYMIGDDQGSMSQQLQECTQFLREKAPRLMPWICGWVTARELAAHGNPFVCWQIYPTLYNTGDTAEQQARRYCLAYDQMRQDCLRYDCIPWPMFNACGNDVSDSLLRFPVYSAIAYGAQGIWYFTYRTALTNGQEGQKGHETYKEAKADVRPNWFVAQKANHRVAAWGPRLLGCKLLRLFSTGWETPGAIPPGQHKVVEQMSDDLLIGILTKPGQAPLAVVVDKRVSKTPDAAPPREVEVTVTDLVRRIRVFDEAEEKSVKGNTVSLSLAGGEGLLLMLEAKPGKNEELGRMASAEESHGSHEPSLIARAP